MQSGMRGWGSRGEGRGQELFLRFFLGGDRLCPKRHAVQMHPSSSCQGCQGGMLSGDCSNMHRQCRCTYLLQKQECAVLGHIRDTLKLRVAGATELRTADELVLGGAEAEAVIQIAQREGAAVSRAAGMQYHGISEGLSQAEASEFRMPR